MECQNLEAGDYWIMVKVMWDSYSGEFEKDIFLNINSYGEHDVHFHHDKDENFDNFIRMMIKSKIKKKMETSTPSELGYHKVRGKEVLRF